MKRPTQSNVMPASKVTTPARRRLLRCRAVKPISGRIAATGGILLARKAGTIAAVTVTPMPTKSEARMVRVEMVIVADGNAAPVALKSAVMPFDTPTPPKMPKAVAMIPMMRASPKIMSRI